MKAILDLHRKRNGANPESIYPDVHTEGVADGLCYLDSRGINLQVRFSYPFVLSNLILLLLRVVYSGRLKPMDQLVDKDICSYEVLF